jgi:hypothetical protein
MMRLTKNQETRALGMEVMCDLCGMKIAQSAEGNIEWVEGVDGQPLEFFTLHKTCSYAGEAALSEGRPWSSTELALLPIAVLEGLGLDAYRAERIQRRADLNIGPGDHIIDPKLTAAEALSCDALLTAWLEQIPERPLPNDWETTARNFVRRGLNGQDFVELVGVTAAETRQDPFRYFCGCCYRRLEQFN